METSQIALVLTLGTALLNVGIYFGYLKGKLAEIDTVKGVIKEYEMDFYKHANDENKHFSARDWKHLNETLEDLKRSVDDLKSALKKQ